MRVDKFLQGIGMILVLADNSLKELIISISRYQNFCRYVWPIYQPYISATMQILVEFISVYQYKLHLKRGTFLSYALQSSGSVTTLLLFVTLKKTLVFTVKNTFCTLCMYMSSIEITFSFLLLNVCI